MGSLENARDCVVIIYQLGRVERISVHSGPLHALQVELCTGTAGFLDSEPKSSRC